MTKKAILALAALAAIAFTQVSTASAAPLGSLARQHKFDVKSLPPLQFQVFCLNNRDQCKASSVSEISYTPKLRSLLSSVNSAVNRQIKPREDKGDIWEIATNEGDCDDYVMTKRHRLIRAGVPSSALRIAVVRMKNGVGHAVLVVKTSSGEYVLDNMRSSIVKKHQSGYRYLRESTANPMVWTR